MEKTRTSVNICGKEYVMVGFESEEYIHRVAICVDRKMSELKEQYVNLNPNTLAVLTASNLADDLLKLQDSYDALCKDNEALKGEIKKLKKEAALEKNSRRTNVSNLGNQNKGKRFDGYK